MYRAVDVIDVGEEIVSLPLFAECAVPDVSVLTPVLDYARCFLNHPYVQVGYHE